MSTSKSKGPVLREIGGGRIRIVTTRSDWETRKIGEGDQVGLAVGTALVAFEASSYRECGEATDLWEFRVQEGRDHFRVFIAGDDIFMVYVPSVLDASV